MKLKLPPLVRTQLILLYHNSDSGQQKLVSRAEDEAIRRYLDGSFDSEPSSPTDEYIDRPTFPIGVELALKDSCDALKNLMQSNGDYEDEEDDEPREKKEKRPVINFSNPSKATRSSSMPRLERLPAETSDEEVEPVPAIKDIALEAELNFADKVKHEAPRNDIRPSTSSKAVPSTKAEASDRRKSSLSNMFHRFSGFKAFDLAPLDTSVGKPKAPSRPKTAPASHAKNMSISNPASAIELLPTSALTGNTLIGASPARASHETIVEPLPIDHSDSVDDSDDDDGVASMSGETNGRPLTAGSPPSIPEKKGIVKSIASFVRSRSKSISRGRDTAEKRELMGGLLRSLSLRRNKSMGNLHPPMSKNRKLQKYTTAELPEAPPMPVNSKEMFAKHSASASRNLEILLVTDDDPYSMLPPATPVSLRSAKATAVEISATKKSISSTLQTTVLSKENAIEPFSPDSFEPLPPPTRKQSLAASSIDSCFTDPQTPDGTITSPLRSHPVAKPLTSEAKPAVPVAKYSIMPPTAASTHRVYSHSHASSVGSSIVYLPSQMPESPMLRTFPTSSLSKNVIAGPEPMVNFSRKLTGLSDEWKRDSQITLDVTALPPVPKAKEKVLRRMLSSFGLRRKH
jgi:hypothetical protein